MHYAATDSGSSAASSSMVSVISQALATNHIDFHVGVVWSTDALYRETRDKVEHYQRAGVLAVEMETSALYSVAQFRSAALGAILVVSDELSSFSWRPGFKQDRFIQGRQTACRIAQKLVCSAQENKHQDR